jgi:tetratricopeptide (TPR) repeat protein
MIKRSDRFDIFPKCTCKSVGKIAFVVFSLFSLLIISYGNSINGAWVFDDESNIVTNNYVQLKTLEWENIQKTFYGINQTKISRPIAYLSFGLNYYFGQFNTFGYHVVNLLIHYVSAFFLFLFIHRTLNLPRLKAEYENSSYAIALLATFFWATSPVNVTAVTYIVQRMASMAGMFYIMSLYFYLTGRTNEKIWKKVSFFILCSLSAALAIGTKENAVMLPVSIYLYDLLFIQGVARENLIKNLRYFLLPAMIVASLAIIFFVDVSSLLRFGDYAIRPFTMTERLLTESRVIVFYISLLLYPVSSRLMLNHDFILSRSLFDPWTTMAAILFILGSIGLAMFIARKKPLISYCILFFFLNHAIEGSFIPLELVFEHTNYTPSMLFFVPLAIFAIHMLDYFSYRKVIQLMAAMLISFLLFAQGHTVYMYNYLFQNPYLLWLDNTEKAPKLSRPHNNVGTALWERGLYDEAFKAYQIAYHLNRYDHLLMITAPINNIGSYYILKKNYETALSYFKTSIKIHPNDSRTWVLFAKTQIKMCDLKGAEITIQQAMAKWPDQADFHALISFILLKQGRYDNALKEAWKSLVIDSEFTEVKRVIGEAYHHSGRYEQAITYWEGYVSKYRDDLEGQLALIDLYSKTGQKEKLDRAIARSMILKGSKSWRELMKEYTGELAAHAYEPDPEPLLRIIKRSLLNGI